MKQTWKMPVMSILGLEGTNDPTPYGVNPNEPGVCTICRQPFPTGADYEAHKKPEYYNGKWIGDECPAASQNDGKVSAEFSVVMS